MAETLSDELTNRSIFAPVICGGHSKMVLLLYHIHGAAADLIKDFIARPSHTPMSFSVTMFTNACAGLSFLINEFLLCSLHTLSLYSR